MKKGRTLRACRQRGLIVALVGVLAGTGLVALPVGSGPAHAQAPGQQCDVENPQLVTETPPAFGALGLDEAHTYSRGTGVTVAVVDSGVHSQNAHLQDVVADGVNVVVDDDPYDRDGHSHGTAAAGIIAARAVEGSAVLGVAPEAMVQSVRVYYDESEDAEDEDVHPTPARIAEGIAWAAQHGAQIINLSMSTDEDHPDLRAAVDEALDNDVLVVASAGNRASAENQDASAPRYPAAYDGVLGVSAVDQQGVWHASASFEQPYVDVVAPGQHVPSAWLFADDCILSPGEEAPSSSWATAYVSGVAALVASRFPDETSEQWAHRLQATATRASTWERDDRVGWGIIQPVAALQFIDDGTAPGPASPVHGAAQPLPEPTADLDLVDHPDPMGPAQQLTRWWLVGAAALIVLALLYSRTERRPRAGSR